MPSVREVVADSGTVTVPKFVLRLLFANPFTFLGSLLTTGGVC
jgi:hypothetical protein